MSTAKPRELSSYKYLYIVNLHLQQDQSLPTFTPVPREPEGHFPRISGQSMSDKALLYTDTGLDDKNIGQLTEEVLRGGPNVLRPDADDTALMQQLQKEGKYSEESFARAAAASDELKATLAAQGHFKFSLV
jgi:hypothetical protein